MNSIKITRNASPKQLHYIITTRWILTKKSLPQPEVTMENHPKRYQFTCSIENAQPLIKSPRKSSATMRTYSKRTRGSNQNFSIKRQRVDSSEYVPISSPIGSESSFSPESHSKVKPKGELQPPLISSPSTRLSENTKDSSSIKSRVAPLKSDRSNSPLVDLKSNHQNRRDNGISPFSSPQSLSFKASAKLTGAKLTSPKRPSKFASDSESGSRSLNKIANTTTESSPPTPKLTSPTRRILASNHTSSDLDASLQHTHNNTKETSKGSLNKLLHNEDTIVTSGSLSDDKVKKSSIRSYFKPIPQPQRSSSPLKSQSAILSDPSHQAVSSPPSSPPPISHDHLTSTRSKPVRRRISTKPNLPNISTMSDICEADMQEMGGDFTDDARVEFLERLHDARDMRDLAIIESGTLIPLAHQPLERPERANLKAEIARPMGFALRQQILDLGQSFHNKCQNCGMQYANNVATDQRLHDNFHKIFRLGGPIFKPKYVNTQAWQKVIDGEIHSVQSISCKESGPVRSLVESILEATLMDMDGTLPSAEQLWSMITSPNDAKDLIPVPRYKIFLYLIGSRPIGILLAERIGKANAIMATAEEAESITSSTDVPEASPKLSTSINSVAHEAYMCIDRLWVHADFRRRGIATHLANQAREKFIPGLIIERKDVAISHPTSVGAEFAAMYFRDVFDEAKYAVGCL